MDIKTDLQDISWQGAYLILVAQGRATYRTLAKMLIGSSVAQNVRELRGTIATCSTELQIKI